MQNPLSSIGVQAPYRFVYVAATAMKIVETDLRLFQSTAVKVTIDSLLFKEHLDIIQHKLGCQR